MITFKPTTETLTSENYPYGYSLRTTKEDWIEFHPKKGMRHCSRTLNPKTNQWNKPKNSTYSMFILLGRDENNHVKSIGYHDFYSGEQTNKILSILETNRDLFTPEQISYLYSCYLSYIIVEIQARATYCGSNIDSLKELLMPLFRLAKDKECKFTDLLIPIEQLDSLKVEGYNPFRVTINGI
jgi:hypothetical protein